MPQSVFSRSAIGARLVRFGGLPLPNGQGTLSYIDLNDWNAWFLQGFLADTAQELGLGSLVWRGRATFLSSDFAPAVIRLSMEYREITTSFGSAIGRLISAGRQYLTFDTLTVTPVRFKSVSNRQAVTLAPQVPRWAFDLEFACEQQWFQDLATTTFINALALNSGSVTNTNVTYGGSVWAEPIWTLTIPAGNAAPIASFRLQNTMSGDDLTVTFPGNLPASTAATVTIDSGALSVVDGNGVSYDVTGKSFPLLYGPAGQVQQISATLTPASGTATGCTLTCVAQNRWVL